MKIRPVLASIALTFMSASCGVVQSPLSDVPISDPSVLRVIAQANRGIGTSGSVTSLLEVRLYDKHDEWVQLKEGSVTVNGLPMDYGGFGQYARNDEVRADANYAYVVTLSDGSHYTCGAHTPKNLFQLTVPASYNRAGPLTVSWLQVDSASQASLEIKGDTVTAKFYPISSQGSFTLQSADLARFHHGQTLLITLMYLRPGQADSRFMSTSSASASCSISRNIQLN